MIVSERLYPVFHFEGLKNYLVSVFLLDKKLSWRHLNTTNVVLWEVTTASVQGVVSSSHNLLALDFSIVHKTILMFSHKILC